MWKLSSLLNASRVYFTTALSSLIIVCASYSFVSFASLGRTEAKDKVAVVKAVAPNYPTLVLTRAIAEKEVVVVETQIDRHGAVTSAQAMNGHPILVNLAEQAARQWQFAISENAEELRIVKLTFVFHIMPPNTSSEDLVTVFSPPYHVEIRSPHFEVPNSSSK